MKREASHLYETPSVNKMMASYDQKVNPSSKWVESEVLAAVPNFALGMEFVSESTKEKIRRFASLLRFP